MTEETYNGWTNRETWATARHIDNDEGLHIQRNELCQKALDYAIATDYLSMEQVAQRRLAYSLDNWIKGLSCAVYFPVYPPTNALLGMFHDVGSIWRVNWDEIAGNWLEDFEAAAPNR